MVAAGARADARPGDRGCGGGVSRLVGDAAGRAAAHLPQGGGHPRAPAGTRSRPGSPGRPARTFGFAMFQLHFVPGLFRQAAGAAYAPLGRGDPVGHPGTMAMGIRRPVGRRRRDRAVERRADPVRPLDRSAARAREHRRPEAVRAVAVLRRPALGRDLRRGRAARRACSTSSRTHRARPRPIGDELVENPLVRRINFTGSTATGRRLAEAAGRNLKRVVLELGGLEPADRARRRRPRLRGRRRRIRRRTSTRARSACRPGRSSSSARSRTSSPNGSPPRRPVLKAGDPREHDTIIGPLINAQAVALVQSRVDDAVAAGARVLAGGKAEGPVLPGDARDRRPGRLRPGAARDVRPGRDRSRSSTARTRQSPGRTRRATASRPASSRAIPSAASRWPARSTRASSTSTTRPVGDEPQMPFGGVKDSGWGRFGGTAAIAEFTELRWVTVQSGTRHFPF